VTISYGRILPAIVASAALSVAGVANATNGYFTHGVGTKSQALAGSGSADPEEVLVIATNPAGLAFVGERLELGVSAFSPVRSYDTTPSGLPDEAYAQGAFTIGPDGNHITSKNELFFIPHIAKSWRRSDQDAFAVAFYGRGGMNTEWQGGSAKFWPPGYEAPVTSPGTFGAGTAGVDLMQAFLNLAYAHSNASKTLSVGASAIFAAQRFRATGVSTYAPYTKTFVESMASGSPVMPTHLSNNGYDMSYGYGAGLGLQYNPTDKFSLAIGYTSKMSMSRFTHYSDLFAQAGGFDIPAQLDVGIAFRLTPRVTFTADVQQIYYEGVASVSNPIDGLQAYCPSANPSASPTPEDFARNVEYCLGGSKGGGFGWRDMTVYKAGLAWRYGDNWTLRAGASTSSQPIPTSQMSFNILAPGVMEQHYTLGFTHQLPSGSEYSVAFMYAPSVTVTGPQNFDPTQTVSFKMYQWDLEFSYAWGR
jgi:long-chain fatty acid transport protein